MKSGETHTIGRKCSGQDSDVTVSNITVLSAWRRHPSLITIPSWKLTQMQTPMACPRCYWACIRLYDNHRKKAVSCQHQHLASKASMRKARLTILSSHERIEQTLSVLSFHCDNFTTWVSKVSLAIAVSWSSCGDNWVAGGGTYKRRRIEDEDRIYDEKQTNKSWYSVTDTVQISSDIQKEIKTYVFQRW